MNQYGQIAYEAYRKRSGFRSLVNGSPLPTWEQQAPAIQDAWQAAAEAVLESVGRPDLPEAR